VEAAAAPLVRARYDLDRGRPDRALVALGDVVGSEFESDEFWRIRAHAHYELRQWNEAAGAAEKGLERDPADVELLDVLALAELERGRKKEARAAIDAAIELYPDFAALHAHRALILACAARKSFRLASYRKPRAAIEEALRLDPQSETARRVRAQIAVMSRDRRAHEYAADLLSLEPDDGRAHALTGTALAGRGDVSRGLRHIDEAARLDPSDPTLAWAGRRSRMLQRRFFAPVLFLERVSRGRIRLAWFIVAFASFHSWQPVLIAAAFGFWIYMWVAYVYFRMRTGREPR
jgi:tetratricopeptide (TPR) repeat protein